MIEIQRTVEFVRDLEWLDKHNSKLYKKVYKLVVDLQEHPRSGYGKPERLKHYREREVFSRQIDRKNRLVYEILDEEHVKLLNCRSHYGDK